jgi:hypothetical protein
MRVASGVLSVRHLSVARCEVFQRGSSPQNHYVDTGLLPQGKRKSMTAIPTNMILKDSSEPGVMQQIASGLDFLIAQLAEAEAERDAAIANAGDCATQYQQVDQRVDQLEVKVDGIGANGEQAMELLRKLAKDIEGLRGFVEGERTQAPVQEIPAGTKDDGGLQCTREELAEAQREAAALRQKLEDLEARHESLQDPEAALRILEDQRDQARTDAAAARADLAIQCAEIETKDSLITALERALEQQHASLRRLEERFAEYASRLHDLRVEKHGGQPGTEDDSDSDGGRKRVGAFAGFRNLFSPPRRLPAPATGAGATPRADTQDEEDKG